MAQHTHYYSCSRFADWLRGTNKLKCGTSKEWSCWKKAAKETHPIRYWIVEEGLDMLQDFITWPTRKIYSLKYYINNRWVTKTHSLTAHPRDIIPGNWCDVGNRFLPCLFNELVDFVEIEQAWSHIAWGNKEDRAKYEAPFWASGWFRWRTWRSPSAGLDHLDWASKLIIDEDYGATPGDENYGKPTGQAEGAREILELYTWWTVTYRARRDPHDLSGWSEFFERKQDENPDGGILSILEDRSEEDSKESTRILNRCREIETQYTEEDEAMMVRLIKIRNYLWT